MAIKTATPVKSFQYVLEIDGIDQFEIQKVTPPEITVDATEHGAGTSTVKTAGLRKAGNAKFEKLILLGTGTLWAWNWMSQANDPEGAGEGGFIGLATSYKRTLILKQLIGTTVVSRERWDGCWVQKITRSDLDRMSSDNAIETVELSVDTVKKLS